MNFSCIDPGPDGFSDSVAPRARVLDHARFKAKAGHCVRPDAIVLASDTLVYSEGEFLHKPENQPDARRMLKQLENQVHHVWTSICVMTPQGQSFEDAAWTSVKFSSIPEDELSRYLDGKEWMDKAGAYGIQGTAGRWATVLEGDLDTVIGLPVELAMAILAKAGACRLDLRR